MPVNLSSLQPPSAATIATAVAGAVPTISAINSSVSTNASPYGGTLTNLGFQSFTGVSSVTFSSLGSYKYLKIIAMNISPVTTGTFLMVRFNGDSAGNYKYFLTGTGSSGTQRYRTDANAATYIGGTLGANTAPGNEGYFMNGEIIGSNSAGHKILQFGGANYDSANGEYLNVNIASAGIWASTSAITSITFAWANGNNGGSVTGNGIYMYGAV